MKLWQKETTLDSTIETFTIGEDAVLDLSLAQWDVIGSIAHAHMLADCNLIQEEEKGMLVEELKNILSNIQNQNFEMEVGMEDIHSQIEWMLTQKLGDVGKKIHTARSRNDQVLVDLRLFFRAEVEEIVQEMKTCFEQLLQLATTHQDKLIPGYTHLQVAMVSSFGLWFSAFAESLVDDLQFLQSTYKIIDQNPLGSAAGYGSSFPIDRTITTQLLGFQNMSINVVHAQMGRGKVELLLSYALAALAQTINKLATDLILYSNQNFNFLTLPDRFTTGSSIMPHKKNPDVFELIRARCNQLMSLPQQVSLLIGNLPSGYHRDFQLLKTFLFPAIANTKQMLEILNHALPAIQLKANILNDDKYQYLYSVEAVNDLVKQGVPFRDAYQQIGRSIEADQFQPNTSLNHTHQGSLGNLCLPDIQQKWDTVWEGFDFEKGNRAIQALIS